MVSAWTSALAESAKAKPIIRPQQPMANWMPCGPLLMEKSLQA
jgi:hypothetical protein